MTTQTVEACQAPLSMGFPRQEHWSGLPFPPPGDLPDPRIEPVPLAFPRLAGTFFTIVLPGKPNVNNTFIIFVIKSLKKECTCI